MLPFELPDACPAHLNASAGTMAPLGDDGIQIPSCVRDCGMALLLMVLPWRSFELRSRLRSQKRPRPKHKQNSLHQRHKGCSNSSSGGACFRQGTLPRLSCPLHGRNTNGIKYDVHVLPADGVWSTSTRLYCKEHRWDSIRTPSHVAAHVYA